MVPGLVLLPDSPWANYPPLVLEVSSLVPPEFHDYTNVNTDSAIPEIHI